MSFYICRKLQDLLNKTIQAINPDTNSSVTIQNSAGDLSGQTLEKAINYIIKIFLVFEKLSERAHSFYSPRLNSKRLKYFQRACVNSLHLRLSI